LSFRSLKEQADSFRVAKVVRLVVSGLPWGNFRVASSGLRRGLQGWQQRASAAVMLPLPEGKYQMSCDTLCRNRAHDAGPEYQYGPEAIPLTPFARIAYYR